MDALAAALGPDFQLLREADLPYLLRQAGGRRFALQVPQATVWRRVN